MNWSELLDHPFWTQVLKGEEDADEGEEENQEEDREGNNGCEGVGSASLRCVDILLFLLILQCLPGILLQPFYCIQTCFLKE